MSPSARPRWRSWLEGGPIAWATEHQIELVGEALNNLRRLAPKLAERIPDVDKILAARNVLVHSYAEVNKGILWQAATRTIPGCPGSTPRGRAGRL